VQVPRASRPHGVSCITFYFFLCNTEHMPHQPRRLVGCLYEYMDCEQAVYKLFQLMGIWLLVASLYSSFCTLCYAPIWEKTTSQRATAKSRNQPIRSLHTTASEVGFATRPTILATRASTEIVCWSTTYKQKRNLDLPKSEIVD